MVTTHDRQQLLAYFIKTNSTTLFSYGHSVGSRSQEICSNTVHKFSVDSWWQVQTSLSTVSPTACVLPRFLTSYERLPARNYQTGTSERTVRLTGTLHCVSQHQCFVVCMNELFNMHKRPLRKSWAAGKNIRLQWCKLDHPNPYSNTSLRIYIAKHLIVTRITAYIHAFVIIDKRKL